MTARRRPRVLLAITVYNGWSFVPACLRSACGLQASEADIDVLVLDDASPEPGFSEKLAQLCRELEISYYRTPRNLGIVRNVNLGLLTGVDQSYDYVLISNSDVLYARQTVDYLVEAAERDPSIGSVTAWSNNVSVYSIPNENPDDHLASQDAVDWIAASLAGGYRGTAIDIPAGISFSMLLRSAAIRDVGLMDPVFGRGYCEETDWSRRSVAKGYRLTLTPAAFVYHRGRGSTVAAGMISGGHSTIPEHEAIIDHRYPLFRSQVEAFIHGGILRRLHDEAIERIIRDAGTQFGYDVHLGHIDPAASSARVQVAWTMQGQHPLIRAAFRGFACDIPNHGVSPYDAVLAFFKTPPSRVTGAHEAPTAIQVSIEVPTRLPSYPSRV